MTLITPVGNSDFSWLPKGDFTKTASTGSEPKSYKDNMGDIAKLVLQKKAEKDAEKAEKDDKPKDDKPKDEKSEKPDFGKKEEKSEKKDDKPADKGFGKKDEKSESPEVDVQKAVSDLVEKSNKAEEIAVKVEEAVTKVEEAVQGVKDAVGAECGACKDGKVEGLGVEEVVDTPSLPPTDGAMGESDLSGKVLPSGGEEAALDINVELPSGGGEMPGAKQDEIVVESEQPLMASSPNDFVRLASVSKETRDRVYKFWKEYLGYPEDYVALMVKNYEK